MFFPEGLQPRKAREGRVGKAFFQGHQDYSGYLPGHFEQKSKRISDIDKIYSFSITFLF